MTGRAMDRCRRTRRIVDAILDGTDTAADRMHIGSCVSCSAANHQAQAFTSALRRAARDVAEGVPDPTQPTRAPGVSGRAGAVALRLLAVGAAVAAGLLVAVVLTTRLPSAEASPAFASGADARSNLELQAALACRDKGGGTVCDARKETHLHEVTITTDGDRIVETVARIANTDGKTLDPSGGDAFLHRVAKAVLGREAGAAASAWLDANYAGCGEMCSTELDGLSVTLKNDRASTVLVMTSR